MNNRDNYFSTAKAIGIILMVVGHTIGPNYLCRFIYMFHMPLFFLCSGYFYEVPDNFVGFRCFIIKKIKGLYFPYVKWSIVFLILHNLFYTLHFYPTENKYFGYYNNSDYLYHLKSILTTMTGHDKLLDPFWFLKELFFASLFVCLISFLLRKISFKYKDLLLLLTFVALTAITKPEELGVPVIWNLSIMFLGATFYYAGYLYRKLENVKYYTFKVFLLCLIVVLGFVLIWNKSLDMLWYDANSVLLYIPIALMGIMMVLTSSNFLERFNYVKRMFYYIGKNTLIILALHLLTFKLASLIKISIYGLSINRLADTYIEEYNQFFWLIYIIFGIGGPLLCHVICDIVKRKLNCMNIHSLIKKIYGIYEI